MIDPLRVLAQLPLFLCAATSNSAVRRSPRRNVQPVRPGEPHDGLHVTGVARLDHEPRRPVMHPPEVGPELVAELVRRVDHAVEVLLRRCLETIHQRSRPSSERFSLVTNVESIILLAPPGGANRSVGGPACPRGAPPGPSGASPASCR